MASIHAILGNQPSLPKGLERGKQGCLPKAVPRKTPKDWHKAWWHGGWEGRKEYLQLLQKGWADTIPLDFGLRSMKEGKGPAPRDAGIVIPGCKKAVCKHGRHVVISLLNHLFQLGIGPFPCKEVAPISTSCGSGPLSPVGLW